MPTTFCSPIDDASATLALPYTAGGASITLASGYGATIRGKLAAQGLPDVSATAPLRFRIASTAALGPTGLLINPALSTIFKATSLVNDTLSGLTVIEGTTDQNYAAGDAFFAPFTAGQLVDVQNAVLSLEQGIPTATGTFIVQTADANLPDAQDLASLTTGLLKSTTATGVVSIAAAGTDYLAPDGNGSGLTNLTAANIAAGTAAIDISGNAATATTATSATTATTATTAGNVTGTVAITNGGTGQITAGAAFNALSPLTTTGDIIYASAANTAARLAGNTTATKQFLTQTGSGAASAAPAWAAIISTDLPPQAVQAITLNTGGVIYATPVTFSVATGTATGTLALATQTKNTALLGPATGANAAPTFRAIATADILAALQGGTGGGTTWALGANSGDSGTINSTADATKGPLNLNGLKTSILADGTLQVSDGTGANTAGITIDVGGLGTKFTCSAAAAVGGGLRVGSIWSGLGFYAGAGSTAYDCLIVGGVNKGAGMAGNIGNPATGAGIYVSATQNVSINTTANTASVNIGPIGTTGIGLNVKASTSGSSLQATTSTGAMVVEATAVGNARLGLASPATTATAGFPYVPVVAGTPTGTPTAITGYAPLLVDSTGSKIWVYFGGVWKSTPLG